MMTVSFINGNSPDVTIEIDKNTGAWIAIRELPNGKFIQNKGLIRATYARAINANTDLTAQQKANLLTRDITQ